MGNCFGRSPSPEYSISNSTRASAAGKSSDNSRSGFLVNGSGVGEILEDASESQGEILELPNLKVFTFADLRSATRNFKQDNLLGEGGFGRVFKGWVDENTLAPSKMGDGMVVAIKKLYPESMQGFDDWQSDVNFLGRLSHPNLVRLLGYCWEDKELLLVSEFMQKGSLENHLFRRNPNIEPLSWDRRLQIAIGAARGLAFLHTLDKQVVGAARGLAFLHTLDKQVVYRDFKASNILLDWNYNAKIANFGLAKLGPSGKDSHVTTKVMGTFGYVAPEYVAKGDLYVKCDVYGFGVVLLELLTGLRVLDPKRPIGKQSLIEWTRPFLLPKGILKHIIDARMEGQYSFKATLQMAQLVLRCMASEPRNRPYMKEVVNILICIQAIKDKPKKSSVSSSPRSTHQQDVRHQGHEP